MFLILEVFLVLAVCDTREEKEAKTPPSLAYMLKNVFISKWLLCGAILHYLFFLYVCPPSPDILCVGNCFCFRCFLAGAYGRTALTPRSCATYHSERFASGAISHKTRCETFSRAPLLTFAPFLLVFYLVPQALFMFSDYA
jgi:hypothetical protein